MWQEINLKLQSKGLVKVIQFCRFLEFESAKHVEAIMFSYKEDKHTNKLGEWCSGLTRAAGLVQ